MGVGHKGLNIKLELLILWIDSTCDKHEYFSPTKISMFMVFSSRFFNIYYKQLYPTFIIIGVGMGGGAGGADAPPQNCID